MNRPPFIPDHATNVQNIGSNLWLWEFSGGAILFIAYAVEGRAEPLHQTSFGGAALRALVSHFQAHSQRIVNALDAEQEREESYMAYLESAVDYEDDDVDSYGFTLANDD